MNCSLRHQEKRRERAKEKARQSRIQRQSGCRWHHMMSFDLRNPAIDNQPKDTATAQTFGILDKGVRIIMDWMKPGEHIGKDNGHTGKNFNKAN